MFFSVIWNQFPMDWKSLSKIQKAMSISSSAACTTVSSHSKRSKLDPDAVQHHMQVSKDQTKVKVSSVSELFHVAEAHHRAHLVVLAQVNHKLEISENISEPKLSWTRTDHQWSWINGKTATYLKNLQIPTLCNILFFLLCWNFLLKYFIFLLYNM